MHHQKKGESASKPSDAEYQKVKDCYKLLRKVLNRNEEEQNEALRHQLIKVNPDIPTLWNIERQKLIEEENQFLIITTDVYVGDEEENFTIKNDKIDAYKKRLIGELKLTEDALKRNHKSNSGWYHRYWCIKRLLKLRLVGSDMLDKELALCEQILQLDCRNFHCWKYRALICELRIEFVEMQDRRDDAEEMKREVEQKVNESNRLLSQRMINENFSNYSAWFLRSSLPIEIVDTETELLWIRQGIYTEPMDQSLWQYYDWLLFHRGREYPRLLDCIYSKSENAFYFYMSDMCSIEACSCGVGSTTSLEPLTMAGWEPVVPHIEKSNGCYNDRILDKTVSHSRVWRVSPGCIVDSLNKRLQRLPSFRLVFCLTLQFHNTRPTNLQDTSTSYNIMDFIWTLTSPSVECIEEVLHSSSSGCTNSYSPYLTVLSNESFYLPVKLDGSDAATRNMQHIKSWTGDVAAMQEEFPHIKCIAGNSLDDVAATDVTNEILKDELKMIEELIELEPGCKYARLAWCRIAEIIQPMDPTIVDGYKQLEVLDAARRHYYRECCETISLRQAVCMQVREGAGVDTLQLQELKLKRIPYKSLLNVGELKCIDISSNDLNERTLLECCLPYYPFITELLLNNNKFTDLVELSKFVSTFKNLKRINLCDNPLNELSIKQLNRGPPDGLKIYAGCITISNCPLATQLKECTPGVTEYFRKLGCSSVIAGENCIKLCRYVDVFKGEVVQ